MIHVKCINPIGPLVKDRIYLVEIALEDFYCYKRIWGYRKGSHESPLLNTFEDNEKYCYFIDKFFFWRFQPIEEISQKLDDRKLSERISG